MANPANPFITDDPPFTEEERAQTRRSFLDYFDIPPQFWTYARRKLELDDPLIGPLVKKVAPPAATGAGTPVSALPETPLGIGNHGNWANGAAAGYQRLTLMRVDNPQDQIFDRFSFVEWDGSAGADYLMTLGVWDFYTRALVPGASCGSFHTVIAASINPQTKAFDGGPVTIPAGTYLIGGQSNNNANIGPNLGRSLSGSGGSTPIGTWYVSDPNTFGVIPDPLPTLYDAGFSPTLPDPLIELQILAPGVLP